MSATPALIARSLHVAHDGVDVLHGISLEFVVGEVAMIAGPNGAGKSTLVETLAGVRSPRRGAVTRQGDTALVLQRHDAPAALPLTVADVVAIGTWAAGRLRRSRAETRAAVAAAADRVGIADLLDRPLAALSGGQRQRAFLAQGLVGRPSILLLDEPAAGLDPDSATRMRAVLADEAARGSAVVCVSHDEADLARGDRVVRLEAGRVVGDTAALRRG